MLLIGGYLIFAIVAGIIAGARGRNALGYFLLSVVLSPVVGIILAAALPNLRPSIEREAELAQCRECPHCAEPIKYQASVCRFCGREVEPIQIRRPLLWPRAVIATTVLVALLAILYSVSAPIPSGTPQEARTTAFPPTPPEQPATGAISPAATVLSQKALPKDPKPKASAGPLRITPQ